MTFTHIPTQRGSVVLFAATIFASTLAGCAQRPQEFVREPVLTPVGAGLKTDIVPHHFPGDLPPRPAFNSLYQDGSSLFRNNTDRSLDSEVANTITPSLSVSSGTGTANTTSLTGGFNSSSKSSANGQGTIDRSEKIQVNVGAVVTEVLPDGNLVVSGSQEVRVNFEIRQVYVAGIVRPRDISKDNTIPYERIAEARISYGGRGRLSEVQQPAWGQQLYDNLKPF
jgi:flagellar L-ring protein precursor FlgH